jgi:hypothetical protein
VIKLTLTLRNAPPIHLLCHVGDEIAGREGNLSRIPPALELPALRFPPYVLPVPTGRLKIELIQFINSEMLAFAVTEADIALKNPFEVKPGTAVDEVIRIINDGCNVLITEDTPHTVKVAIIYLMLKGRILSDVALTEFLELNWSGQWATYDDPDKSPSSILSASKSDGTQVDRKNKDSFGQHAVELIERSFDNATGALWREGSANRPALSWEEALQRLHTFITARGESLIKAVRKDWSERGFRPTKDRIPVHELLQAAAIVANKQNKDLAELVSRHTESLQIGSPNSQQSLRKEISKFLTSGHKGVLADFELSALVDVLASSSSPEIKKSLLERVGRSRS